MIAGPGGETRAPLRWVRKFRGRKPRKATILVAAANWTWQPLRKKRHTALRIMPLPPLQQTATQVFTMPSVTVFLDTNTLFTPKPARSLSQKALATIDACRAITDVSFHAIETVADELAFKRFRLAQSATTNLGKNAQTIREATGIQVGVTIAEADLKQEASRIVEQEFKDANIALLPVPIGEIDWPRIVHDSCWRHCVFANATEEEKLAEKGFRDRVIMESVLHYSGKAAPPEEVTFISRDALLRDSFEVRCREHGITAATFDSIDALLNSLKLRHDQRTKGWTEKVLNEIDLVFFDPTNPDCLYLKEGIQEQLVSAFSAAVENEFFLRDPAAPRPGGLATLLESLERKNPPPSFRKYGGIRLRVGKTSYKKWNTEARLLWETKIEIACQFSNGHSGAQLFGKEIARILEVGVNWSCEADLATGELSNARLDTIDDHYSQTRIVAATYDVKGRFQFQSPPFYMPGMDAPPTPDSTPRTIYKSDLDSEEEIEAYPPTDS